jgi:hypothetical protein
MFRKLFHGFRWLCLPNHCIFWRNQTQEKGLTLEVTIDKFPPAPLQWHGKYVRDKWFQLTCNCTKTVTASAAAVIRCLSCRLVMFPAHYKKKGQRKIFVEFLVWCRRLCQPYRWEHHQWCCYDKGMLCIFVEILKPSSCSCEARRQSRLA